MATKKFAGKIPTAKSGMKAVFVMRPQMSRRRACLFVLYVIRNPLLLLSPEREEAIRLANSLGLTAAELLSAARDRALDA